MRDETKSMLVFLMLISVWAVLFVVLHEGGHRSIYYDFGINSTIVFFPFGAYTLPEGNATITETIILAHAIHESISTNTVILCILIMFLYVHYVYVKPKN